MANVASAEKRNRQRQKRRLRNLNHLTTTRTLLKRARVAVEGRTSKTAEPVAPAAAVAEATRQLDRAAQKGVISKRTASRKVSRLTKALARAQAASSKK